MLKSLYIMANGPQSGKSVIALGLMKQLVGHIKSIAIFRPILKAEKPEDDADIPLLLEHFRLKQSPEEAYGFSESEAAHILNTESRESLIKKILAKYKALAEKYDFILCIGSDFHFKDLIFEFGLNSEIAGTIGASVILVVEGKGKNTEQLRQSVQACFFAMQGHHDVIATIITRNILTRPELELFHKEYKSIYAIPEDPTLGLATLSDIAKSLGASFIGTVDNPQTPVSGVIIAAMHLENFLSYLEQDMLVITPGDRPDILLATLASKLAHGKPSVAGILFTGDMSPSASILELLKNIPEANLPLLVTKHHTYRASRLAQKVQSTIAPNDTTKINTALSLFEHYVDGIEIREHVLKDVSDHVSTLMFEEGLVERARKNKQRIVLCEGEEPRILQATHELLRQDSVNIILLGNTEKIQAQAQKLELDISKATVIDPLNSPDFETYAEAYCEFRKKKGMTIERAREVMADATYFGTMMVKKGSADGMVSGAINTTAHTIRPSFEFIKTRPGFSVVSSVFLMCVRNRIFVFGDCAVNPNPTAEQLAEIAITSAETAKLFGIEPRVAMLSYSTGKSGKGPDVDEVAEATRIAQEKAPDLLIDGPLQYDAAINPIVAKTKMPQSKVAGRATVFIFPDLNTGNNAYKAVQRASNAVAIGPILQGLRRPVNDLSRGCLVPDIINTVIITAIQATADTEQASTQTPADK